MKQEPVPVFHVPVFHETGTCPGVPLDYQNRRPDHLAALWQIVDWKVIEDRWA